MSNTVAKCLRVLETLVSSKSDCRSIDIATTCGITKTNAHRLLKTLERAGYVRQDSTTKAYSLTLKIWELGNIALGRMHFTGVARPHLEWLANETGEAVHLAVYDHGDAVTIDQVESRHAVRAFTQVGGRAPAYAVATGKAMLAFRPASEIDSLCRTLRPITEHTINEAGALRAELARVQKSMLAVNNEEWQLGVRGVASPIVDASGNVVASIGICGPSERVRRSMDPSYGRLLRRAALALSTDLGLGSHQASQPQSRAILARPMKKAG